MMNKQFKNFFKEFKINLKSVKKLFYVTFQKKEAIERKREILAKWK